MRAGFTASLLARRLRLAAALGAVAASVACAVAGNPAAPSKGGATGSSTEAALVFCTDEINRYRASVGLSNLGRAGDLEDFAARAAEHDGRLGVPHAYFRMTNGGGVARAENQLLLWKGMAVDEVIRRGMANMWAEGPGGSHYEVLTGNYSEVGCGVFVNGNEVNVSQEFR